MDDLDKKQDAANEDLPFSDEENDGKDLEMSDPESTEKAISEINEAEVEGNEKQIHQYKHFVVHEATGKVEILDKIVPGIVTYTFNPTQVTPKDIRYMIEAVEDGAGLNSQESVKIVLEPKGNIGYADVILDIRNRSNIEIGTMELWRYNK